MTPAPCREYTFQHPTAQGRSTICVRVYRGPFLPNWPAPLPGLPVVSDHDLENASLGFGLPLLKALGPSPEDHLRKLRAAKEGSFLCRLAQRGGPVKGAPRGAFRPRGTEACVGADEARCRLGVLDMPLCWEGLSSPDVPEIVRSWTEGVYVALVHG